MLEPRSYQLETLEAIEEKWVEGITRQLVSLPTGVGKTIVFALLAKSLNTKTLIVAHTFVKPKPLIIIATVAMPELAFFRESGGKRLLILSAIFKSWQTAATKP